jgi:hypothetical protein
MLDLERCEWYATPDTGTKGKKMLRRGPSARTTGRAGTRFVLLLGLVAAGALATAGIAWATATSTVPGFLFTPSNPGTTFTPGTLTLHVHTDYTSSTRDSRIQLFLDDDFQFNPNSLPKCDPAELSGNITMMQAMQRCGPPAGAAKNAWLWPPTATTSNGTAHFDFPSPQRSACVLAFNGQGPPAQILLFIRARLATPGPIYCGNPSGNTDGDGSELLVADLRPNPAIGTDYTDPDGCSAPDPRQGCQLDISGIDSSVPFLTDLNFRFRRGNYVRARCVDPPAGNRLWNLEARFTYVDPTSSQTVLKSQTCS